MPTSTHQLPTARRVPLAVCSAFFTCALTVCLGLVASADQTYRVTGKDTFSVGAGNARSEISYDGHESLHRRRSKASTVYTVSVRYIRIDQGASSHASASYAAVLSASGEQHDLDDGDPDYLTVLNQPFSVQLDAATLRDLAHLASEVPFDFPAPMTGATLHGRLRRIGEGVVSGARALGVSFDAAGGLRGALPDRPNMSLNGHIRMQGEAYYRSEDALLVMLDATLTITGKLTNPSESDPVTIVYRRTIRAQPPADPHRRGA